MFQRVKSILGVMTLDVPRYARALCDDGGQYLGLCNRTESLIAARDGSGFLCDWRWTSDLHAPTIVPTLGRWLVRRALSDHPIGRSCHNTDGKFGCPDVSFIIGHRGTARLTLLLATIESIAAQVGVAIECVVVEQDRIGDLRDRIPTWVQYVHTPTDADMPYCRSWAFNVGARIAKGRILVLHDNDLMVPEDYAAQIMRRAAENFDVINLKRFIFYLSEQHTMSYLSGDAEITDFAPEAIMQNAEAGGSIAIARDAYERIGGMDEAFIGWGGEDNEFWERAQTCRVWPFGCLPLVHLWHAAQPRKQDADNPAILRYRALSQETPQQRIARLRSVVRGSMLGPTGYVSGQRRRTCLE